MRQKAVVAPFKEHALYTGKSFLQIILRWLLVCICWYAF